MSKYRKLPVEVEAVRVYLKSLGDSDHPQWFQDSIFAGDVSIRDDPSLLRSGFLVATPFGPIYCRFGDWVVRDQFGHLWPYTDEDFHLVFEEIPGG